MSRYNANDNIYHYEYGHDHFSGYFVQLYSKVGRLICEIDEFAGLVYGDEEGNPVFPRHSFNGEKAVAACQTFFDKLKRKEIHSDLMIRDPKTHLGAAIGKAIKENRNV